MFIWTFTVVKSRLAGSGAAKMYTSHEQPK
jgi:hypothetical protein